MGSSLAWVSAHSASGSEPATMPAPATSRARRAVELGAAEGDGPLAVAAGVDPADRDRRSGRGRSPRARGWRRARRGGACRRPRGWGGATVRARARWAPASVRRPRIGVARWATGPNTATSGVAVDRELARSARRARRRCRRRRSGARGCPSPTPPAPAATRRCRRRWCRRPGATPRRRRCGARAARGSRRRSPSLAYTNDPGCCATSRRTIVARVERRCRLRSAPRARARPSRARRRRWPRARARPRPATRRACAARRP